MKHFLFPAIFLLAGLSACGWLQTDLAAKVVGIKDGDSIEVLDSNQQAITVRLSHVDCPEHGQPFSRQARQFTSDFCFGKNVVLEPTDTDRYGRLVCEVFVEGHSLNLALVEAGLAWHHTRYSDDYDFELAEEKARREKKGLWTDPDPVPPWEWRRNQRN